MQAKYRTSENNWGVITYPVILMNEHDNAFSLTAYASPADAQLDNPLAGIYDVMEFEVFHDTQDGN